MRDINKKRKGNNLDKKNEKEKKIKQNQPGFD